MSFLDFKIYLRKLESNYYKLNLNEKEKGKLIFIPYDIQIEYEELGEFITL